MFEKRIIAILVCLSLILLLFGCLGSNGSGTMGDSNKLTDTNSASLDRNGQGYSNLDKYAKVKVGDTVKVDYVGKLADGSVFDSSEGRDPLEFTVGAHQMIRGFEDGVVGMKVGEKKDITIPPEQGYGVVSETNLQSLPKSKFPADVNVGQEYVSEPYKLTVMSVNDQNVIVAVNHFLAGKTLLFEVTLVSIN